MIGHYDKQFNFKGEAHDSKFVKTIKYNIFSLQYLTLQYQSSSLWIEIISLIIQYFQVLFFFFEKNVYYSLMRIVKKCSTARKSI